MTKEHTKIIELKALLCNNRCINKNQFEQYYLGFVEMDSTIGLNMLKILNPDLLESLQAKDTSNSSIQENAAQENAAQNAALFTLKNAAQTTKDFVATKWNNLIELVSAYHSMPSLSDIRQTAIPAAIVVATTTATAIVRATGFGAPDANSTQAENMCYESKGYNITAPNAF